MIIVENFIKYIKDQTGLVLEHDKSLQDSTTYKGLFCFDIDLQEQLWNSQKFYTLERLSKICRSFDLEPNGVSRVAVTINKENFFKEYKQND